MKSEIRMEIRIALGLCRRLRRKSKEMNIIYTGFERGFLKGTQLHLVSLRRLKRVQMEIDRFERAA